MSSISKTAHRLFDRLTVENKVMETRDSASFFLSIPPELKNKFEYSPGQFITFFLEMQDPPLARSYSIMTSPGLDASFGVTVKRVPGGLGSNFLLDKVQVGSTLLLSPPSGFFFKKPEENSPRQFFLFAAGSGITPIFSILKWVMASRPQDTVTLVFGNRDQENIIYKKELESLGNQFQSRLQILHVLSKPIAPWNGQTGRVTKEKTIEILKSVKLDLKMSEFYMCGPDGFMTEVEEGVKSFGAFLPSIHKESFSPPSGPVIPSQTSPTGTTAKIFIGDPPEVSEESGALTVCLEGEIHQVSADSNKSILDSLLEAGVSAPFSCMSGSCLACLARIEEGVVFQEDMGILSEENLERSECLTCQAKPQSKIVKLTYDGVQ